MVAFSAATRSLVPALDDRILVLTDERCRLTDQIVVVVRSIPKLLHQVQCPSLAHAHNPTMILSVCDQSTYLASGKVSPLPATQLVLAAAAFFKPYPYNKKDYFQVCLLMLAHSPAEASPMGTVILSRIDEKGEKEDREHSLLLQIGGDSLLAISSVVMGTPHERPVALDLLWKVQFTLYHNPFSQSSATKASVEIFLQ